MTKLAAVVWALGLGAFLAGGAQEGRHAADRVAPQPRLWRVVPDAVYLQEIGEKVLTPSPVTSVAVFRGKPYAVLEGRLKLIEKGKLLDAPGSPTRIKRLRVVGDALWAASEEGVYRLGGQAWELVDKKVFVDFCLHLGSIHGATRDELYRWDGHGFVSLQPPAGYLSSDTTVLMEDFSQVLADPVRPGPVSRLASYSGTLYWLRPGGLALLDGQRIVPDPLDWGALPSPVSRDLLAQGARLYVATDGGLGVLRGMAMTSLRGADGLPYEDVTCLAAGFDGDLWIGTSRGAIRKTGESYHYFGAHHWLPGEHVHDIAAGEESVWIATEGGLAVIRYEPYTLLKKANYFQRELEEWGFKRLGFIHKLYWSDNDSTWLREISDNDGGHTAPYTAAMAYKYAVTGDESARQEALESFGALVWLHDITGIPGFIARAIWSVKGDAGERATRGSGGLPAKWYSTDDGLWFWKGDTSSDEVNAHIYAAAIFHDLAARGPEKVRARRHIADIAAHIMDNGWVLRDKDGKPTRWGRWDPDYLLRPYGYEARGLNGMEAQTYMITAFALTGDPKFNAGLQQLLNWRYHTFTVRQRLTFPPDQVAPWDDQLAFFCYNVLLRYAKDPDLRSIYLRSLERSWEILRMQQLPFYNFTYGALTGNDCEALEAVNHLREWSLDLVNHSYRNSHRSDLAPGHDYVPYGGGTCAFSPRELEAKWGARVSIEPDGGANGKTVTAPVGWLHDYWMGRYYGFIEGPTTTNSAALTVEPRPDKRHGAAPYSGTPKPAANR